MIIKRQLPWIRMLFSFRDSPLSRTLWRILGLTVFSVGVTAVELLTEVQQYSLTATPFTLIGFALGIFLGFRNSAAYDRFWEGRKLWGQMVNSARSFAREVLTLVEPPADRSGKSSAVRAFQQDLVRRMIAYVHAFRHHLRDTAPFDELATYLPGEEMAKLQAEKNVPIAILLDIAGRLKRAWRDGWLSDYHLAVLEGTLTDVTNVQGGCERIKNTPIPYAYTVLTHRLVAFYCLFLPFGIVDSTRWLTPVVVLLVSHAFFGLDEIGDEIEEPFGMQTQDLPLSSICRTIEVNLLQSIDADDVPELMQPVDGVLA